MNFKKLGLIGSMCTAGLFISSSALALDTASVAVSANVTGVCKFNSGAKSVSFTLDPSVGGAVTGSVVQPTFWCTKGSTYAITDNDGANSIAVGAQRMKHATLTEFIPYTFTYTAGGTGLGASNPITMNIASTVAATDYINASAGSYADTVVLSINP